MNLLEYVDQIPPCICRLVARKNHGRNALTHRDLAKLCGISKSYVADLSMRSTWRGVPIEIIQVFGEACGVDFARPNRVRYYLRTYKKIHVLNSGGNGKKMFQRMFTQVPSTDRKLVPGLNLDAKQFLPTQPHTP